MHTGTHAFGLDETFIEPQILPPPPTRHALLAFLLALTAILHLGTSGWSDIHNGAEGRYVSIARALERTGEWTAPGPPLHYWLTIVSFKLLGATAVAARLPVAIATVAAVAFTFLLGELLHGLPKGIVEGWEKGRYLQSPAVDAMLRSLTDREEREREEEVGEAHQDVVDPTAVIAGDRTEHDADDCRDDRHQNADLRGGPDAVNDAAELVAPEVVGAEGMSP